MPINPVKMWADSYESKLKEVYKNTKTVAEGDLAAIKLWQDWVNDNGKGISCIAPLVAPIPLSGSTNPAAFSPLPFKTAVAPPMVAQILATAWQGWANAIMWTLIPPAPPFSSITSIIISPASVAASYATLYSGLVAELAVTPADEAGAKVKYMNLATLFFTATSTLQVMFIGLTLPAPTPVPLVIPVPIM